MILKLYDIAGRERRTIHDARLGPGERLIQWNPAADDHRVLAPGVYFIRLGAEGWHESVKMILVP